MRSPYSKMTFDEKITKPIQERALRYLCQAVSLLAPNLSNKYII